MEIRGIHSLLIGHSHPVGVLGMMFMTMDKGFAHLSMSAIREVGDGGHTCRLEIYGKGRLGFGTEGESLKHARQLLSRRSKV